MKKKIAGFLICLLIAVCGFQVMAREWQHTAKTDSEYKEKEAKAKSSAGEMVVLEEEMETEEVFSEISYSDKSQDAESEIETVNTTGSATVIEETDMAEHATDTENGIEEDWHLDNQTLPVQVTKESYQTGYIFVGDSRFYLMNQECNIENVPNFFVVSCPGMGYTWLAQTALAQVRSLQETHKEVKNWVVICGLGVNDLTSVRSYLNKYRRWPDSSKLYLLSVNPTKSGAGIKYSNARIESFNKRLKTVEGAVYLDCYDYLTKLGFGTQGDGLHYDVSTNWAIYSYILTELNEQAGGSAVTEVDCQKKAKQLEKQLSRKKY